MERVLRGIYMEEEKNLIVIEKTKEKNTKKRLSRVQLYFLYFLIFSIIGWIAETFYSLYELGHFTKRGFLFGPLCPIYGWGAIILIIFFSKYKNHSAKLFIYSAVIFSIFEYVVSYGMDALFASQWWDYTNEFFNLNGRISIFYSIVWGIAAILFVNHIYPYIKKKFNLVLSKIPYSVQIWTLRISFAILLFDNIMSFAKYLVRF